MVQDSQGRLVVADTRNHRLHLVGADTQLSQFLLTKDDGIKFPECVCLDKTTARLFVGYDYNWNCNHEIRLYKWPRTNCTQHTLDVELGRYQ